MDRRIRICSIAAIAILVAGCGAGSGTSGTTIGANGAGGLGVGGSSGSGTGGTGTGATGTGGSGTSGTDVGGTGIGDSPPPIEPVSTPPKIAAIPDIHNSPYSYEVIVPLSIEVADGEAPTITAAVENTTVADVVIDVSALALTLRPKERGQSRVTVEVSVAGEVASTSFEFIVEDVTRQLTVTSAAPAAEAVMLTNSGPTAVEFDLTHNGHLAFSSMDQILAHINSLPDEINGEPVERKIWRFVRDNIYHFLPIGFDQWLLATGPMLDSFGFALCSNVASAYVQIAQAAGYEARARSLTGHVVPEIRVNGAWHLYDPDLAVYYYMADGTVAGVDDLAADTTLITSPVNRIFSPGENDVLYSEALVTIYGSSAVHPVLGYLPTNPFLGPRLTLPAGARLIYPGSWTAAPTGYNDSTTPYTPETIEYYRQARLELPGGSLGSVPLPWVLWDVQGAGTVRILGREFAAGSAELQAFLAQPGTAIQGIEIVDNPSGLALIMMINPLWYDMLEENQLTVTGKDVWALDSGTYPLDIANLPPPPVPPRLLKPRA